MSPDQFEKLKAYSTFILRKRGRENEPIFDAFVISAEKLSSDLSGESTKWEITDHQQEVDKLRDYAEDLLATGEIIIERRGFTVQQLIVTDDTPVAEDLVNRINEMMTRVKTKLEITLKLVKGNISRQKKEEARFRIEIEENTRAEVRRELRANEPAGGADGATPHAHRASRFQASEGSRPEIVTGDCTYGEWQQNSFRLSSYMRSAVKPEVFSPKDQQVLFMDFLSPAMRTQVRDKLSVKPEVVWEDCIDAVEALMETRNPLWNRRQKSFSLCFGRERSLNVVHSETKGGVDASEGGENDHRRVQDGSPSENDTPAEAERGLYGDTQHRRRKA